MNKKGKVIKTKIENAFGLPDKITMTFSYFQLLAIKECIEKCYKHKLFNSCMLENHSYTVEKRINKRLNNPKARIERL